MVVKPASQVLNHSLLWQMQTKLKCQLKLLNTKYKYISFCFLSYFHPAILFSLSCAQLWLHPLDPQAPPKSQNHRQPLAPRGPYRTWKRSRRPSNPCSPPTALLSAPKSRYPTGSPTPHITSSNIVTYYWYILIHNSANPTPQFTDT